MKRKRLDRDSWESITQKRYAQKKCARPDFCGIVSLLCIDGVSGASRWEFPDGIVTVCDCGMKWLEILPDEGKILITAMFDGDDRIVLWYVDMIAGYGFDADGTAWFDDLYLDLIVKPDGFCKTDDYDELTDALAAGDITEAQFAEAVRAAEDFREKWLADIGRLEAFCLALLRETDHG